MSSVTGQVSSAAKWLNEHTLISGQSRQALIALAPELLAQLPQQSALSVAIAGAPGSGKSTLARLLGNLLNESGRPAVVLALDDYYLSSEQRKALARNQHRLLRQRGVPGTHDWQRLLHDFDRLREGKTSGLRLPVFDKSTDDPAPRNQWRSVGFTPCCLILEGWCIGAPSQDQEMLAEPVNELERSQDREGNWRRYVNDRLACYYSDIQPRIDRFWYLNAPDWNCIIDWRWQQERELTHARLHSRADVAAFLAPFQRIVGHMRDSSARWADWRLQADQAHCLEIMK